jgi:hypothetical protein
VEEHLHQLTTSSTPRRRPATDLIALWDKKLNWVLTSFVSLILLVCGTLLAVVIKN